MTKILALLNALLSLFKQWRRGRKADKAQERRDAIDKDSAQYVADRYGDGNVRVSDAHPGDADQTASSDKH